MRPGCNNLAKKESPSPAGTPHRLNLGLEHHDSRAQLISRRFGFFRRRQSRGPRRTELGARSVRGVGGRAFGALCVGERTFELQPQKSDR